MLYKDGPQRYHSTYVVIVQVVKEGTSARDPARDRRPMSWTQLMGLTRLLESVGKVRTLNIPSLEQELRGQVVLQVLNCL